MQRWNAAERKTAWRGERGEGKGRDGEGVEKPNVRRVRRVTAVEKGLIRDRDVEWGETPETRRDKGQKDRKSRELCRARWENAAG